MVDGVSKCVENEMFITFIFTIIFFQALASLDCAFENGYCGWQQNKSNILSWQRSSGSTFTEDTGPSTDHTNGDGFYIYIEARSGDPGDEAHIFSEMQEPGQYCLVFWYNMYGEDVGTLNVYQEPTRGSKQLLFTKTGNADSQKWMQAVVGGNSMYKYKIMIEGVRGNGDKGDIAVDDITVSTSMCSDCNFDNGLCHWVQSNNDDFDWTLNRGETSTTNTGPSSDHTSKNGQYIYIDASGTSIRAGHKARIVGPKQTSGKYCLSFWYYMYGEHVDGLIVGRWRRIDGTQTLFYITGNQGKTWIQKNITIQSLTDFQIIFEGRVKNAPEYLRYRGDIALDDVIMYPCQDCDNPTPKHGIANSTYYGYGSVTKIKCDVGYELIGESIITCQTGGSWSPSRSNCTPFDCGNMTLYNGTFNAQKGTTFGETGTHECKKGYILNGEKTVLCTASGWNNTNATCKIVECGDPTPKYANINSTNFAYDKTIKITCKTGYYLTGQSEMVCTENGDWSTNIPTCNLYNTANSTLSAVYVAVPVMVVALSILFLIFYFRKRLVKQTNESQNSNTVLYFNTALTDPIPERKNTTNQTYADLYTEIDHEYMTIKDNNVRKSADI